MKIWISILTSIAKVIVGVAVVATVAIAAYIAQGGGDLFVLPLLALGWIGVTIEEHFPTILICVVGYVAWHRHRSGK